MKNQEMMTMNLRRIDVCDIKIALTSIIIDMQNELRKEGTSETRKEILKRSISKWERLKAEVNKQFSEQDEQ